MGILDRQETNLTPIFIVTNTAILAFLVINSLIMVGRISKIADTKTPTLVELNDGTSVNVVPIGHSDRTAQAMTNFVGQTMVGLMNWNSLKPTDSYMTDPTKKPMLDGGVQSGNRKVTTGTWAASFALSEDFRDSFLKELALLTPQDVFGGQTQSFLIVRHLSEPHKQSEGKWSVDLIANLVIFHNSNQLSKAISFNKTIFVRAIDTPLLSTHASELQKTIYQARKAGLEIYKIQDFELGK